MRVIVWIMNIYTKGSYKTFLVASCILVLAVIWFLAVAYPDIATNRSMAMPIELSLESLADFTPTGDQYYIINGSEILDTGWESTVSWEGSNEVIVRHYLGALVVGDRLIIVKALNPINPAKTTFMGNIYWNSSDENDAISDLVQQVPDLEGQFLSLQMIERDGTQKPSIFTFPVFVTCLLVWFSLMGFFFFIINGRKNTSQSNQVE